MKILSHNVSNKLIVVAGAILAALLLFIFLSIPSRQKPPDYTQDIAAAKAELEKQYNKQLKEKDDVIKDAKAKLILSEGKYKVLASKYTSLQKEKENVKPPTTNKELRDRFTALDYSPLPGK